MAHGAEPQALWSPGVEELGFEGFVVGEFDGHEGLDKVATYRSGESLGLVFSLSGSGEDWALAPAVSEERMQLRTGQWDSDDELEILLGLPGHLGEAGQVGAAWVLDLSGQTTQPAFLEDLQVLALEGSEPDAGFGEDLQLFDCNEAAGVELLVSQPGGSKPAPSAVWAFGRTADGLESVGVWNLSGEGSFPAFGLNLQILEKANEPYLALSACEAPFTPGMTCKNKGVLMLLPARFCSGAMSVNIQSATATKMPSMPQALHSFVEGSTELESGLVWASANKKSMVNLKTGIRQALSSTGDSGAFVQNASEGVAQTWVSSSGSVWQIPGVLEKGDVELVEGVREHVLSSASLGHRLANVGDINADGCEDVLSTSSAGDALYLLPGCDSEVPEDTGDTGEDTGKEDTGHQLGDTGIRPCDEHFGWACSVPGKKPKSGIGFALISFVFWRRRRKQAR